MSVGMQLSNGVYSKTGFATIEDAIKASGRTVKDNSFNIEMKNLGYKDDSSTRELGDVSFEIKRYENLDPFSISFEDYQNLNYDTLETIFGKYTQEWHDAVSLLGTASGTGDDILNKIVFDTLVETKGETKEWKDMQFAIMFSASFDFNIEQGYHNNHLQSADDLFVAFDMVKQSITDPEPGRTWSKELDTQTIFNTMDKIKQDYETKVKENEALLASYTRNNKPQTLEDAQAAKEQEELHKAMKALYLDPNSSMDKFL